MIRNESEILNVEMSKPPKVASRPAGGLRSWNPTACLPGTGRSPGSKNEDKYYLKLKDMLITRCRVPRTFLAIQTVDG